MKSVFVAFVILWMGITASAEPSGLKPELQGIEFLVGHWVAVDAGKVAETGGTSEGTSSFTSEVGGSVLLRKDQVKLFDRSGKPSGGFDILMMIYPEAGTLHADYSDGEHVIHYTSAEVTPGRSVSFKSAASPQAPTFKLEYGLNDPNTLDISFSMAPPGSSDFHPIATGKVRRHT